MPPRVSLSMIVRNEAQHLARALETARLYADEIVIVDTGSTDSTRQLAAGLADRLFDFAWVDDFAAARNFAAERCTGELVMWLDADDVVPPDAARALRALLEKPVSWDLLRVPYELSADGRGTVTMLPRVWRNFAGLRWKYPIHELLDAPRGSRIDVAPAGARIVHAPILSDAQRRQKHERNLRILQGALAAEHHESAHLWFHLAKEYRRGTADEQRRALDALSRALALEPERGTFLRSRQHFTMAEILHRLGRDDEALASLGLCLGEHPHWREPFWLMSEILRARRQSAGAVALLRMGGQLERHQSHLNRAELYGPEWNRLLSIALEEAGDLAGALEEVRSALRRAPDEPSLLAREEELLLQARLEENPPRLLALAVDPRAVRPGEAFEATFTVHTRRPLTLGLGLSLRESGGDATISDPPGDVVVRCPPGESRQTRLFSVPPAARCGTFDVDSALRLTRDGRLGRRVDRLSLPRHLLIRR